MYIKQNYFLLLIISMVFLSGCDDTKRALGIDKSIPDEFAVVRRAPLVMPPNYNLRPPAPGSNRPQEGSTDQRARFALVGQNRIQGYQLEGFSPGEVELLANAGADQIIPSIRDILKRESSAFAFEKDTFTDRLIFWKEDVLLGTPIDPVAEKKRLESNKESGKSPNDGPIPVISKSGSSLLGVF